jgi:hypothetical protein
MNLLEKMCSHIAKSIKAQRIEHGHHLIFFIRSMKNNNQIKCRYDQSSS